MKNFTPLNDKGTATLKQINYISMLLGRTGGNRNHMTEVIKKTFDVEDITELSVGQAGEAIDILLEKRI